MKQVRQGDVLLIAREDILPPRNCQPKDRVILAEGELTGHAHVLTAPKVYEWSIDGQRYVRMSGDNGTLFHEDHDPQPVKVLEPEVTYQVIIQQEWDLKVQWRKVQD